MDKSMVKGLVIGAIAVTAIGAVAGYQVVSSGPSYATVTSVEPVVKKIRTPREVCRDEVVTEQAPTRDPKRVTGAVVGAVIGGVLGNQVGDGSGQAAATVAGAAAGGYAGSKVQKKMQQGNTVSRVEQRCTTVYDTAEKIDGYDVRYTIGKEEGQVRMDKHPGERIPLKDGELVL